MLQETINEKSTIKSKCFTNNATYSEGTIATYMSLNLFRLGDQKLKKSIMIFPGSEYTINFYDAESANRKTLTGMVMEVFGDDRTNQYLLFKYKESVDNKKQVLIGSCGCNLNNPSGSYDDYPVKTIPIQNIFDMQYGPNNPLSQPCECGDESSCKGGWTTVLLGIDATLIRAVTINMKLLDDQCDNAVKYIEMKENGIYQIAYCKPGTSTVYEFDGRLTKIEPLEDQTITSGTGIVHCNCCTPSENVGVGGSIYTSSGYHCDMDHFMSDIGPWADVQLTFDTSEMADGDFETINLSWIRGVEDVTPDTPSSELPDNPGDNEMNCGCCANNILSKGIVYYVNQDGVSLKYYPLTNKMVSVSVDGTETEIHGYETAFEHILNPDEPIPDPEPEDPNIPDPPPSGTPINNGIFRIFVVCQDGCGRGNLSAESTFAESNREGITIGKVKKNTDETTMEEYPYICEIDVHPEYWLNLMQTSYKLYGWDKKHTLVDPDKAYVILMGYNAEGKGWSTIGGDVVPATWPAQVQIDVKLAE